MPDDQIVFADIGIDPSKEVLTLQAARGIAARSNPDIHAAIARLEAAAARVKEAQSRYAPVLLLTHTSARTLQTPESRNRLATLLQPTTTVPVDLESNNSIAVTALLNAIRRPLFASGPSGNSNPFSEHSTAMTATWTLFDGLIREAQVLAAKYVHVASIHSLEDVRRLIIRAVDRAYYSVQLADERLRIARAAEEFSREQLDETEKLRQAGRASETDVGNFRVRMLSASAEVSEAEGQREQGRTVLAELLALDGATMPPEWELAPLADETVPEMTAPDLDGYLARAMASRPDVGQLEQLLKAREEEVHAARGAYSPSVTLSGSYGFDHSETLRYTNEDQSSAAAVEVRWELFSGGVRAARVGAAEASRSETAADLARIRLAVQSDVRTALIAVVDAQHKIRLQRESLTTAHENRRVIQAAYRGGRESLTRLNETQRDFIAADANLAQARIQLRRAWSDLHAACAMPPP